VVAVVVDDYDSDSKREACPDQDQRHCHVLEKTWDHHPHTEAVGASIVVAAVVDAQEQKEYVVAVGPFEEKVEEAFEMVTLVEHYLL
jgi:hypothetical protein